MEINREIFKSSIRIKRRKIYQFLLYFVLCVAFLFALSNFVFKLDKLAITQILISGNKNIETASIFKVVHQKLSGTYYRLYSKNNILIYPKEDIRTSLMRNFIWLQDVNIASVMGNISLVLREREPIYLWCDSVDKPILERTCYYLDENGFAFAVAPRFSSGVYLSLYGGNRRG